MLVRILDGDFEIEGAVSWMRYEYGRFRFLDPDAPRKRWWTKWKWIEYGIDDVTTVDAVAVEEGVNYGASLGYGALGAIALGAVGFVYGAVAGGNRLKYEIEIVFRDGKRVEVQISDTGWEQLSRAYRVARREAQRRARREARGRAIESTPPPTPSRGSRGSSFDALGRPRAR